MNKLSLIVLVVGVFVVEVEMIPVGIENQSDEGSLEVVVERLAEQVTLLNAQLSSVKAQLTSQISSANAQLTAQLNSVNTDLSALKKRTGKCAFFS